jgi:hypothetical protein
VTSRVSRTGVGIATLLAVVLAACGSTTSAAIPRTFYGMVPETTLTSQDFTKMKEAGVGSLRFQIYWPSVKPGLLAAYDWDSTDAIVVGAAERGIKLLPYLDGTPGWASGRHGPYAARYDPFDTGAGGLAWKLFVQAAVQRYEPGGEFWRENPDVPADPIRTWMVWNEQNSSNAFRPAASASRYEQLLEETSKTIKATDPSSKVVLGGMFGTPGAGGAVAHTAWGFLKELYARGAKPYFDGVALHPYSPDLQGIRYQVQKIRSTMKQNGDSSLPLYITELGWGSDSKHINHISLVKSPQGQAQLLTSSYRMLRANRKRWRIGGVYWFAWRDPPSKEASPCTFCRSSGLLTRHGVEKPAYSAYVDVTH